jgi:hypothetical protein
MLDRAELVRDAVRLRRAHRRHPTDDDLLTVRAHLERAAGPTVGRAATARLLGVSQTALDRWIATGDVPVILTARGRREVPLRIVLDLVEAVDAHGDRARPLAAAMRTRRASRSPKSARNSDDGPPTGHRTAELRGLAYHRAIAERLDDALVADALVQLRRWRDEGRIHRRYADRWAELLSGPREQLLEALCTDDEPAAALRQSSPFAGVFDTWEQGRPPAYDLHDAMPTDPFDIDRKTWQALDAEQRRLLRPSGMSIEAKLRRGQRLSAQAAALRRAIVRDEPPVRRS